MWELEVMGGLAEPRSAVWAAVGVGHSAPTADNEQGWAYWPGLRARQSLTVPVGEQLRGLLEASGIFFFTTTFLLRP